jgi:hypothetical protein
MRIGLYIRFHVTQEYRYALSCLNALNVGVVFKITTPWSIGIILRNSLQSKVDCLTLSDPEHRQDLQVLEIETLSSRFICLYIYRMGYAVA